MFDVNAVYKMAVSKETELKKPEIAARRDGEQFEQNWRAEVNIVDAHVVYKYEQFWMFADLESMLDSQLGQINGPKHWSKLSPVNRKLICAP